MTRKQLEPADVADLEQARDERQHPPTTFQAPPQPCAVANPGCDRVVFFDVQPLAFGYAGGIGSATLAARRQLVDTSGRVYEDLAITALLRAPMAALRALRDCINAIEQLEAEHAAAAVAAMQRTAGSVVH